MRFVIRFVALAAVALPLSMHAAPPSNGDVAQYAEQQLVANYPPDGPGAAVIIARGENVLFRGARGLGDVEHGTALSAQSLFDIGSITKQFAAAALLKLVEAGKVSLDDPLSKFVGNYPNGDSITVLELLNHTSGIKNYSDLPEPERKVSSSQQLVDRFKKEKPEFAPGGGWAYDNSGYVLVGVVIEKASGMPWHQYLKKNLFQPLGLRHTSYGADAAIAARRVHGYALEKGKPTLAPSVSTSEPYADGALVSSVDDLLKWNLALHKGRVLKSESYRKMITPVGQAAPENYGFGLWYSTLRNHPMLAHSGHISGFSAYLLYLPESDISVVVLQNMDRDPGIVDPTTTARKLAAFAIGDPYPTPARIAVDANVLHTAEGNYGVDLPGPNFARVQGARVVRVINGKLTIALTGDVRSELIPIAPDTFLFHGTFDQLHLERDGTGAVTAVRIFPWSEGEGLLLTRTNSPAAIGQAALALPRSALERLVGSYLADGMELRVTLDGGRLKGRLVGQPEVDLVAESPGKFLVSDVDATLEFAPAEGAAQTSTLHQGNEIAQFKRVP